MTIAAARFRVAARQFEAGHPIMLKQWSLRLGTVAGFTEITELPFVRIIVPMAFHALGVVGLVCAVRMTFCTFDLSMSAFERKSRQPIVIELDSIEMNLRRMTSIAFLPELTFVRVLMTISTGQLARAISATLVALATLATFPELRMKTCEREPGVLVVIESQCTCSALHMAGGALFVVELTVVGIFVSMTRPT